MENITCFECESKQDIHMHHIIPRVLGGKKTIPLCSICHGKVHSKKMYKMSHLIKVGIKNAKMRGIVVGRRKGTCVPKRIRLDKHKNIVDLLMKNESVRNTAKKTNRGISTVQRIRKVLIEEKMI